MRLLDIMTAPWAIQPEKLLEIRAIYETHLRGEKIDLAGIEARLGRPLERQDQGYAVANGVAVVPIDGVIARRMNLMSKISGGASSEIIGRDVRTALEDPAVHAIVLRISSPGGAVDGTQELAAIIENAAGIKPVVAFAEGLMASAAYWIGAAADQVYVSSETTQVGSIGVVATHVDVSQYEQNLGVKTTEIAAGKYKRIASQYAPLSDEGRAAIQEQVDQLYTIFVNDVARLRDVDADRVLADMADGRVFLGREAVRRGLADGMSSLDGLIAQLARGGLPAKRRTTPGAGAFAHEHGAGVALNIKTETTGDRPMDKETIERDHPELAAALRAEGALAERERIRDVEAQAMPGHDDLIARMKFDGKTSGAAAAVEVLAAEKQKRATYLASMQQDAPQPVPHTPAPADSAADDTALPVEDRCKAKWDRDAALRAEFGGKFDAFVAFAKAEESGRARIKRA